MADLQNSERRGWSVARESSFELRADVAGQQQLDVADPHAQHDRVVVARLLPLPLGCRRVQRVYRDAGNLETIALAQLTPRPPGAGRRPREIRALAVPRYGDALPDLAWPKVARHRQRTADVVGVGMREREPIQTADAERPQRGRHDPAADVELTQPTGIDQERLAGRPLQRERVALSHIQH